MRDLTKVIENGLENAVIFERNLREIIIGVHNIRFHSMSFELGCHKKEEKEGQ